jgi:hypothetical protein
MNYILLKNLLIKRVPTKTEPLLLVDYEGYIWFKKASVCPSDFQITADWVNAYVINTTVILFHLWHES